MTRPVPPQMPVLMRTEVPLLPDLHLTPPESLMLPLAVLAVAASGAPRVERSPKKRSRPVLQQPTPPEGQPSCYIPAPPAPPAPCPPVRCLALGKNTTDAGQRRHGLDSILTLCDSIDMRQVYNSESERDQWLKDGDGLDWRLPTTWNDLQQACLNATAASFDKNTRNDQRVLVDSGCTPWTIAIDRSQFEDYKETRGRFCVLADGKKRVKICGVGTWCIVLLDTNGEPVRLRLPGVLHIGEFPMALWSDAHAAQYNIHTGTRDTSASGGSPMCLRVYESGDHLAATVAELPLDRVHFDRTSTYTRVTLGASETDEAPVPMDLLEMMARTAMDVSAMDPSIPVTASRVLGEALSDAILLAECYYDLGAMSHAGLLLRCRLKWAVEYNRICQQLASLETPPVPMFGDIHALSGWRDLSEEAAAVDLLVACPSCCPFSIAGPSEGMHDPRVKDVWVMIQILAKVRPLCMIVECTAELAGIHVQVLNAFRQKCLEEGYAMILPHGMESETVLESALGGCQARTRFIGHFEPVELTEALQAPLKALLMGWWFGVYLQSGTGR